MIRLFRFLCTLFTVTLRTRLFNITEHPTAQWTAQQLVEAFPFDTAPRYLLRDGDAIYGQRVQRRIRSLGMKEIITAPASPWQNPYHYYLAKTA